MVAKKKCRILVVDDNAGIRSALKILLPLYFSDVELMPSPKELMSKISSFTPDVLLMDMNFHAGVNNGNEGLFWLAEVKAKWPGLQVVLFTAYADVSLAVEGMKRGAFDFVVKPWENDKLVAVLSAACERTQQLKRGSAAVVAQPAVDMYWGESAAMQSLKSMVERIAATDANVLLTGENGTGKDVLANEIHRISARRDGPMVSVDVGAITDALFESELFGHVKGAFTDAHADKVGKLEAANGGTIFLDEIGNIPLHLQAKLLRALNNRSVVRVGDTAERPIDVRLICATNADLGRMVHDGSFREDLLYRVNTVAIKLPPLRERREDIVPLARLFLRHYAAKYHRSVSDIEPDVQKMLRDAYWQGNIRELRNCIERAVIMSATDFLRPEDVSMPVEMPAQAPAEMPDETLDMAEERAVRAAMLRHNGNLTMVAKSLGISRPTLYSKLKKYNL